MINLGGYEISFTNSALYMFIVVRVLISGTPDPGHRLRRAVVPGRWQSIAEMTYEFVANTVRSFHRKRGMKFFPFVFYPLFMFVLFANLIWAHPLFVHRDEPGGHHGDFRAARVFHRGRLRLLEARPALSQSVRSKGRTQIDPSSSRRHRGVIVPVATGVAQRAIVRQHVGRPHHVAGLCRLRHHARERGGTRRLRRYAAAHHGSVIVRARASRRVLTGLCVRDSHLHLSQ